MVSETANIKIIYLNDEIKFGPIQPSYRQQLVHKINSTICLARNRSPTVFCNFFQYPAGEMKYTIGRKAAIDKGEKFYLAKKPCPNGHSEPRRTSNGSCPKCARQRERANRAENSTRMQSIKDEQKRDYVASLRIIAHTEAARLGRVRYFTGLPCSNQHIAERYVAGGHCLECHRLAARDDRVRKKAAGHPTRAKKFKGDFTVRSAQAHGADVKVRRAAAVQALKRFQSDVACPKGHLGERYVLSGGCTACGLKGRNPKFRAKPLHLAPLDLETENAKWIDTKLLSRGQARELHTRRYFDGTHCDEGHRAPRYVRNNECVACSAIRKQRLYHADEEFRKRYKDREAIRGLRPDVKARKNATMRRIYKTPAFKKKLSERRKSDPLFRTIWNLRNLLRMVLRTRNAKKTTRMEIILGLTYDKFLVHIARQFLPGMSWQNKAEWELDHIVPVSEAASIEDVMKLFHHTNLRPLWTADNRSKGSKRLFLI